MRAVQNAQYLDKLCDKIVKKVRKFYEVTKHTQYAQKTHAMFFFFC